MRKINDRENERERKKEKKKTNEDITHVSTASMTSHPTKGQDS